MYEVELKFPVADTAGILAELKRLDATPGAERHQEDRYFAHPVRDFAQTDEAFRIRTDGESNRVTYKGPVVDAQVKSRQEIEISFADGADSLEQLTKMLTLLGFCAVRTVAKRRVPYHFTWGGREIELVIDNVEGLGQFVEIETIAAEAEREQARDAILALAGQFGLQNPERRSYLCQLLDKER